MFKPVIVIPHYNHTATLRKVAEKCLLQTKDVAVFDDGSSEDIIPLLKDLPIGIVKQTVNKGKGSVILLAANWAKQNGFSHIITIDADGQHNPEEYPLFLKTAEINQNALIIGKRIFPKEAPFSSRFGRSFGGFWIHLQTGQHIEDIQSGYRCYPVDLVTNLNCFSKRYAYEVEIVARSKWAGFPIMEIPISVYYPKAEDRVSHFNKLKDNIRLTILNTYLTIRAMLPIPHRRYCLEDNTSKIEKIGYFKNLMIHLKTEKNISHNALSAAWGIFCGSIAFPGIRQVMLFYGIGWWNLNRIIAISFEKFCIGPIVPALCIEMGYFLRYGHFLTSFTLTTLGKQFLQRVWEWIIGSLIVAPLLAGIVFCVVWVIGKTINWSLKHE